MPIPFFIIFSMKMFIKEVGEYVFEAVTMARSPEFVIVSI